ncbi:MAG: hypothetical protein KAU16_05920 [Methanophagales archaeon]|nr:hypothetical protein [Methanophagales archaeon]
MAKVKTFLHTFFGIPINASAPVTVHTKGGDLVVELKEEGAYLVGPVEVVYEGEVELRS